MSFETCLTAFLMISQKDARVGSTHVCLFIVLLYQWNQNQKVNPFQIRRTEVMRFTKIRSRDTFTRSIKLLHEAGYIRYIPSCNPDVASMVCINDFS